MWRWIASASPGVVDSPQTRRSRAGPRQTRDPGIGAQPSVRRTEKRPLHHPHPGPADPGPRDRPLRAARLIGVKVEEFGIGIPPRLNGWRRNGVLWSLNWIPFGGFVKVLGEDGHTGDPESFNAKSPAQRAFFLIAGSR